MFDSPRRNLTPIFEEEVWNTAVFLVSTHGLDAEVDARWDSRGGAVTAVTARVTHFLSKERRLLPKSSNY